MSETKLESNKTINKSAAWKLPAIVVVLIAAVLVGLWQYWSWGPYTVRLEAPATKTNDFVVECRYGVASFHSIGGPASNIFITGNGQSVTCPRRFLWPFGVGISVHVYHPEYQEQWFHSGEKHMGGPIMLRPQALSEVMAQQDTEDKKRVVLSTHIMRMESRYLPEFDLRGRNVLADRYVSDLQEFTRQAGGIYSPHYDDQTLEYIDDLFRKPRP
jgi:hypothetical protein